MNRSSIDDSRSTVLITEEITAYWGLKELGTRVSEATGSPMASDDLFHIRQPILNIEKAFITIYPCFSRAGDMLPRISADEPIKSGRHKGEPLDESRWNKMLDEFYESHESAKETVEQTRDSLLRLGIRNV